MQLNEDSLTPTTISPEQQFVHNLLNGNLPITESSANLMVPENSMPLYKQEEFNPSPIPENPTHDDYLRVLGLDSKASFDEAQKAFRSLARRFHPDINSSEKNSVESFLIINSAYDELKKLEFPQSRKIETPPLEIQPPNTQEKSLKLFEENPTIQRLKELKELGKISDVPEDVGEIEKNEGRNWKDCLALIALLALDVSLNKGRGITALTEEFLQNELQYRLIVPTLHFFNFDEETIEKVIAHKGTASKGIFELQPEVIEVVIENMTPPQRKDLVESLTDAEKKTMLLDGKDPYGRLSKKTIEELFRENNLPPGYISELKKRLSQA